MIVGAAPLIGSLSDGFTGKNRLAKINSRVQYIAVKDFQRRAIIAVRQIQRLPRSINCPSSNRMPARPSHGSATISADARGLSYRPAAKQF